MNKEIKNSIDDFLKDVLNEIRKLYERQADDVSYYDIQEKVYKVSQKYKGERGDNKNGVDE